MLRSFTGANISKKRAAFMITKDKTTFQQTPSRVLFFRSCFPDKIFQVQNENVKFVVCCKIYAKHSRDGKSIKP